LGGWLNEWFSLGISASSSTIKTGLHEKDESGVKHNKSINQSNQSFVQSLLSY
jgi:hypothetical protein